MPHRCFIFLFNDESSKFKESNCIKPNRNLGNDNYKDRHGPHFDGFYLFSEKSNFRLDGFCDISMTPHFSIDDYQVIQLARKTGTVASPEQSFYIQIK